MINNDWQALAVGLLYMREITRIVANNAMWIDLPMCLWSEPYLMPSPLCQAPSARCSALWTLHLWPSGILGRWGLSRCPSDLEFTVWWSAGSGTEFRHLQATTEDDTFLIISAFSTLGVFCCRPAPIILFDLWHHCVLCFSTLQCVLGVWWWALWLYVFETKAGVIQPGYV